MYQNTLKKTGVPTSHKHTTYGVTHREKHRKQIDGASVQIVQRKGIHFFIECLDPFGIYDHHSWCYLQFGSNPISGYKLKALNKSKNQNFELAPSFYMPSYLIDYVCCFNSFLGMSWENDSLPIHIRYK